MADLQALLEKLSGSKAGQTAGALLQGGSVDHLDWPDYAKTTVRQTRQMLMPPANPATQYSKPVVDALYGAFVEPVKQAGEALRGRMTENEAQNFALEAAAGLIPVGRGLKAAKGIRAYHGSPHDFDRFDMSKIGTGEGAQAYGHGLYFAEKEGVAADYRKRLAGGTYRHLDTWFTKENTPEAVKARTVLREYGNDPVATAAVLEMNGDMAAAKLVRDARSQYVDKTPGRMYEVNINAHPDQFIDWDAPLSKQPKLEQTMRRIGADPTGPGFEGPLTGAEGYRALQNKYFLDQIAGRGTNVRPQEVDAIASQAVGKMAQEGIPGIKYLDQGSRTAGEGSRNYVVFDDKLIDILRKYGIAGIGVGGVLGSGFVPKAEAEPLKVTVRPE